jgi:hypothetical protein
MNIVEVGWLYTKSDRPDLGNLATLSQPNFPTPFHFEKINFYIGIGLHKLKKDVLLK